MNKTKKGTICMALKKSPWLFIEFLFFFGALPLLILALKSRSFMIALLWGGALAAYLYLKRRHSLTHAGEWNASGFKKGVRGVSLRFAIAAPLLAIWAYADSPPDFMSFPLERPQTWAMVMLLYPVLSVWPQEILFRSYLFFRYQPFWQNAMVYRLVSALSFGYAHILLGNLQAVLLSTALGFLLAYSYERHRSLALACFEHALYGCLAFTLGLGRYLYTGSAWG